MSIDPEEICEAVSDFMPDTHTVRVHVRTDSPDVYGESEEWTAQRLPRDEGLEGGEPVEVSVTRQSWRLFTNVDSPQTYKPVAGYRIEDDTGIFWEIERVDQRMGQLIFNCQCVQDTTNDTPD